LTYANLIFRQNDVMLPTTLLPTTPKLRKKSLAYAKNEKLHFNRTTFGYNKLQLVFQKLHLFAGEWCQNVCVIAISA